MASVCYVTESENALLRSAHLQVAIQGRTTKASDVFSFGVLMCEVCSMIPPWAKQGSNFVMNHQFPTFAPGTPPIFQELALR